MIRPYKQSKVLSTVQRSSRTTFENKGKKERKDKRQFNNNLKEEVTSKRAPRRRMDVKKFTK